MTSIQAARSRGERPLQVFLCHSSGDKPTVRGIYRLLIQHGFAPWLDEKDIIPGQDWQATISEAVRTCDVVVVCLSRDSISKEGYVQKEINFALNAAEEKPPGAIFLIPARLEEVNVPQRLARWQWVDLFQDAGFAKLIIALNSRAKSLGIRDGNPESQRPVQNINPSFPFDPRFQDRRYEAILDLVSLLLAEDRTSDDVLRLLSKLRDTVDTSILIDISRPIAAELQKRLGTRLNETTSFQEETRKIVMKTRQGISSMATTAHRDSFDKVRRGFIDVVADSIKNSFVLMVEQLKIEIENELMKSDLTQGNILHLFSIKRMALRAIEMSNDVIRRRLIKWEQSSNVELKAKIDGFGVEMAGHVKSSYGENFIPSNWPKQDLDITHRIVSSLPPFEFYTALNALNSAGIAAVVAVLTVSGSLPGQLEVKKKTIQIVHDGLSKSAISAGSLIHERVLTALDSVTIELIRSWDVACELKRVEEERTMAVLEKSLWRLDQDIEDLTVAVERVLKIQQVLDGVVR